MQFQLFTPEQDRIRANLADRYGQWLDLRRVAANNAYRLVWKSTNGVRYLYETWGREGNGRSLGAETPALVERHRQFQSDRIDFKLDMEEVTKAIAETASLYATLRLPMVDTRAAEIFREADIAGMLGTQLLVVGTNAMMAYEMEAGARIFMGFDATADCDLAFGGEVVSFTSSGGRQLDRTLLGLLRSMDATYTVNSERPFQARNRKTFEVELLAAPSVIDKLPKGELVPVSGMIEQDWLLKGRPVNQIVCGLDRKPTRIICPDPRWMALHKTWLSQQDKRRADKRSKDAEQGKRLFAATRERMPQYPFDAAFEMEIPEMLGGVYEGLKTGGLNPK